MPNILTALKVIREYCFSRSFDHISMPDYNSQATDDIYNFVEFSLLVRFFCVGEFDPNMVVDVSYTVHPLAHASSAGTLTHVGCLTSYDI